MKRWISRTVFLTSVFFMSLSRAEPLPPEVPPSSAAESLVKSYVDQDFIHEELPPPQQCEQYSKKLMFAYDWNVVIHKIGPYDPARKLLPVAATIIVRCGPFQSQPPPPGEATSSEFPLRSETPIDFQMIVDPENAQQWKIQAATLWKSKQKIIQE